MGDATGEGGAVRDGAGGSRAMNASDRGSATVWSVAAIAVLCFVFGIVLALGDRKSVV